MSNIKRPAIERAQTITNTSKNTQQAITQMADFDEKVHREIINMKTMQENKEKDLRNQEAFEFNPEEIQTLVSRNKEQSAEIDER